MAHKLNKHTPNSDELLKRLESNDSSGLDDFDQEALEGFDSLENVELAKNLTDSLNKKIDEKYFKKESGNKKGLMYLSMAAGLILVVGLSYFFMTFLGQNKEVAMSPETKTTEQIANEVAKPTDIAPTEEATKTEGKGGGDANTITTDALAEKSATGGKDISNADERKKTEADKDDGLTSRMVVKETKPEQSIADNEGETDFKKQPETKTTSGPPAGNTTPASPSVVMLEDAKAKDKAEETIAKTSSSKNNSDANKQEENEKASGVKKRAAPKKEKAKSGEALASDDVKPSDESAVSQTAVGGIAVAKPKRDESGNLHNVEYGNHAYYKPQDYLKVEINKSEMLKTNVKAFKAELTINEKGTVTAVKFLTTFDNCTGCKKELEKILLNMPGWKPKSKSAVETVSYIDQ